MKNTTNEFSFVLKPSTLPKAGVGVFATHDIAAGTKLAIMPEGGESRTMPYSKIPKALQHFPIIINEKECKAPKAFNHLWIVWYLNHSHSPNIELRLPENNYYARANILAGTELLVDYKEFDEPEELRDDYYKE